ncbi:hypothetical protein GCM10011344_29310 [Dokdonia pacifica]|uniref:Uncharacterized protein n=2 Tax=Dokdonia pacifica TaxID=1627892 RepID=A0A239C5C5_9FLAO|nr:hypothetical protein [Dokdonia pacifica]GGG26687.1 hypothetical protein GCM10011344_29310 [Dokdonia pacifica]SNS14851.1 hypothetical protein SAMN06265376_107112 [Dokdonia pacifica]
MKMKKILLLMLATVTLWSCSSDDSNVLPESFENGVIISIADITTNVIFNNNLDGRLDIDLEYRDAENGSLLDKVDIFVTFLDKTDNTGNNNGVIEEEVLLRTVENTGFSIGDNDFPVHNLVITTEDYLSITNNTLDGITAGDEYITRFEVTLTDGRVFSTNNTGSNGGLISNFNVVTSVE